MRQIESGILVCPVSKQRIALNLDGLLATASGANTYQYLDRRVPILITDQKLVDEYARSSKAMNSEYTEEFLFKRQSWFNRVRNNDYRTPESIRAMFSIFDGLNADAVCISIGGGPTRVDQRLINVNIGPFPNVDIVADAHSLPYQDASVDAVHCEAVFEHLHSPTVAAAEIARVLKPGGTAFVCTPFLQAYHGYPHHYQNFTLTGHVNLFERSGLSVTESGTCVGPTYVFRNMIAAYVGNYLPYPINKVARVVWAGISLIIAPLELFTRKNKNAHVLSSMTYLIAKKA